MWVEPKPIGIYNHSRRSNIFSSDEKNYLRGPKMSFMHTICVVCCWRSNFRLVIVTPLAVKINAPGTPSCFKRGRYPACYNHSKNKVVKWTTLGLSNWCQKRTPQSRPKLVIWMSRRMTTLMSSQKQPESRQMTTFLLVSLSYDDLVITLERLNDKPQIVKWWSCD